MGDVGDDFRAHKEHVRALKAEHGVDCPGCRKVQPKRIPTRLLPGQRCKVCGHRDPRPRISNQ
jgi:rRNA maturation endonuclease Nob1